LHDNAPTHKAAIVCQFLTSPKKVTNLYHPPSPVISRFISDGLFSVPQVENEVKRTSFCGCCWDPKKVQKEEFSAALQKMHDRAKACIYANGAYFEFKKKLCVFLMCLRF